MTLDHTQSTAQNGTFNRQPQNPPVHLLVPVRTLGFGLINNIHEEEFSKKHCWLCVKYLLFHFFIEIILQFYWGSDSSVAAHILGGWLTQRPSGAARVALFNL